MPEPEGDHGDVDPGEQEPHGGGMPEGVDGDVLGRQGRAAGGRPLVVKLDGRSTASRDSRCPEGPGNSGSPGCPPRSASQAFMIRTVAGSSGVSRSFRPLSKRWHKGRYLDVSVIPMSHM
jgi:hypothetical protein